MPKKYTIYHALPVKTSQTKYLVYVIIDKEVEEFLYDGTTVFTPEFPDIPVEKIDLDDGRVIGQETLARVIRHIVSNQVVVYNKDIDCWESIEKDDL